ncbi:hypothetical protein Bca52824_011432 [Brassica carinata]|uniref:Uncharacterized protein n=1 Tax=Brassica carinata TaxID=52824 RepID=A0A8X8B8H5_BRACI|nr:hypothetical protein Bca52824_011432 [Brassica carinata]
MSPRNRLSREEKGKAVAIPSSPTEDTTARGSPLDDFSLIHRDAMRDTVNLDMSQRLLVADAHRLLREGGSVSDDGSDTDRSSSAASRSNRKSDEDSSSSVGSRSVGEESDDSDSYVPSQQELWKRHRRVRFDQIDCRPTVYHPGGIFEELPALPAELLRDPWMEGQR